MRCCRGKSTAQKHALKYGRRQADPDNEADAISTQPRFTIYFAVRLQFVLPSVFPFTLAFVWSARPRIRWRATGEFWSTLIASRGFGSVGKRRPDRSVKCGSTRSRSGRAEPPLGLDEADDAAQSVALFQVGHDERPLAAHPPRVGIHLFQRRADMGS